MTETIVEINLENIRRRAEKIRRDTGVDLLAVVKADAYGLRAEKIATALRDIVDGFCVFSLAEAQNAGLADVGGRPILALGPPGNDLAEDYLAARVRPAVTNVEQANRLRAASPIVSVDTGMQRFACPEDQLDAVISAAGCVEAFTHATQLRHVEAFTSRPGLGGLRKHAAGSALLNEPAAWLDAVRPGIALYRDAVEVSTPLVETHDGKGPAGYTGFITPRHGVILVGYSHGLRPGPCNINGIPRRILEVGMQSAFVEISPADRVGEKVILLGQSVPAARIAQDWKLTEHEVLLRLAGAGQRVHREN